MVKKQHQQLGGLIASLFSSGSGSGTKDTLPPCHLPPPPPLRGNGLHVASQGHSFREEEVQQQTMMKQAYYKTTNSAYSLDYSCFSNSFADSFSTANSSSSPADASEAEAVICGLRSDRIFFEPGASSCIFKQAASKKKKKKPKLIEEEEEEDHHANPGPGNKKVAFDGATAMSVESQNPYRDFRESMEAMVMCHGGVKDWSWLEEMLGWYLKANNKNTHGLIIGAFVDLLVSLSNTSSSSSPANCSISSDDECSSSL